MNKKENSKAPLTVRCPICGKNVVWGKDSPFRPFCSEKCKLIDLGEWASDGYRIKGKPGSADTLDSGDLGDR